MPKHLAEKIRTSKAALEGERKHVTVLFADLKSSMELLADRDPEEARKLLDPVIEYMMEAVHRYEGTVNQVMGDGIMALFGAPLALEDHAVRACYAALRMQQAVKRYAESVRREHGVTIRIRVGLNSGEVVVRSIGSDLHMDYTAVGQTTHLAARMEQLADPGSVLLPAATFQLVEGYVEVEAQGPVPVKGLSEPVQAFELVGAGMVRSRLQAAVARGLTRFVGREKEREQLRHASERAVAGQGQLVAVVGEPGVGKSRLYYEFIRSHCAHGWLILESGSVSYGKATTYLPIIGLLNAYFRIDERDDARAIRERVTGKLLALDRSLEPALPALLSLLDAALEDPDWKSLEPPQRRERILDGMRRLLIRESQVQPLLLLVEDLHWIDTETQTLLDRLVESLPTARILLLLNYRPEYKHPWGSKTYYTQLRLDALPAQSAEDLLFAMMGDDPGLQPLKRLLIQRTEGNPFFLEESVRTLVETKVLVGERGAYRATRALESIEVPPTIQAVLSARIDRLSSEERSLLQVASVIGETVPLTILQAVAEVPDDVLQRALAQLRAAEFLYEGSLYPDLEYTFKHGLTYQVAYTSLLLERRRTLHARIVGVIERRYPGRLGEHIDRLAHHAFRGELWEQAAQFLREAASKAAAQSAYREAADSFERALAALQHLPKTRGAIEQEIDLRFALRSELQPLGEHEQVLEHLRQAESLAVVLGDQDRLGWASAYLSQYAWVMGDSARAEELGQRALAIASTQDDFPLRVAADHVLGQGYCLVGDYQRSIEHCRRNVTTLQGERVSQRSGFTGLPSVLSRFYLGACLSQLGKFAEACSYGMEAIEIAEAAGQPYDVTLACAASGAPLLARGSLGDAIPFLERGVETCRTWNVRLHLPGALTTLGSAYILAGRLSEALPLLEEGARQAGATVWFTSLPIMINLATGYLAVRRMDEAKELAARAVTLATERKSRGNLARALRLLGEISVQRDPIEASQAQGFYRQALTISNELGMRPLVAHCHAGLSKLYRRIGGHEQAQEHLTAATTMYRELDMGFWLEKVRLEKREVG